MNKESENNRIIRQKLDERQFEVSQEKWDAALKLIKQQERKKRRRLIFYLLIPLGLLVTGSFFMILNLNAPLPGQSEKRITAVKNNPAKINATSPTRDTKKIENINKEKQVEPNLQEKSDFKINLPKEVVKNHTALISPALTESKTDSPNNTVHSANAFQPHAIDIAGNSTDKITSPLDTIQRNVDTVVKPNSVVNNSPAQTSTLQIDDINTPVTNVIQNPDSSAPSVVEKSSAPPLEEIKPDSIKAAPVPPVAALPTDTTAKKSNRFEIHSLAGIAYSPGFKTNLPVPACLNPLAGFFVVKYFNSDFSLSAGLQYALYSSVNKQTRIYTSTLQEFGYTNSVTEIQYSRIHYLKAPIVFNYSRRKNTFGLGPTFGYLITSSSLLKTYTESYGVVSSSQSVRRYGYTEGLNPFDVSLVFTYRRNILRYLGLGMSVEYGFSDVKDNAFFNSATVERNKSVQLFMSYKLYK